MSRKGEETFEGPVLSGLHGLLEEARQACLRVESHCGNADIKDMEIERVTVSYRFSTDRDIYGTRAAIVRDSDPEPEKEPATTAPKERSRPLDADDAAREDDMEPSNLFDEIEYNDEVDLSQYHEDDATGVPYGASDRAVSPHGETLTEDASFEEDDIAKPLRSQQNAIDPGAFNGH